MKIIKHFVAARVHHSLRHATDDTRHSRHSVHSEVGEFGSPTLVECVQTAREKSKNKIDANAYITVQPMFAVCVLLKVYC